MDAAVDVVLRDADSLYAVKVRFPRAVRFEELRRRVSNIRWLPADCFTLTLRGKTLCDQTDVKLSDGDVIIISLVPVNENDDDEDDHNDFDEKQLNYNPWAGLSNEEVEWYLGQRNRVHQSMAKAMRELRVQALAMRKPFQDDPHALRLWDEYTDDIELTFIRSLEYKLSFPMEIPVQSLTKVHHRNLVSLVGYCWEEDHLALVYEYMTQGSLFDHLRGKNGVAETLNWKTRVRVVLEAAQGLDYLHKGCKLPIIHRDVKTSNILLGRNLQTKLADFGLCKTYLSDSQTHISATPAGSGGYIDPEYYHTGRLTESSDVYSFGVVLLEVATGRTLVVPGHGHIVQHVNQMITAGDDISSIADVRLEGAYDVNSMWKVVDTGSKCTSDAAAQRPTMATVMAQLKESLALEKAHHEADSSATATLGGDISALLSSVGPSAR